jgi:hypothetical protein
LVELVVFANKLLDPKSNLLPNEQWGVSLKYTDKNWKVLKKIHKNSRSNLLEEAVQIYYAYKSRKGKAPDMSN